MKKVFLVLSLFVNAKAISVGFWDDYLQNGNSRTEYHIGEGTGFDHLTLDYGTDNLPGKEGCLFDAIDSFGGCPGRAGLLQLPNGEEVWEGTIQRFDACGGDDTKIGGSWVGCITYSQSPYFEIGNPGTNYWVIGANDDPSFDQFNEGPPNLSHPILPFNSSTDNIYKVSMDSFVINNQVRKKLRFGVYNNQHVFSSEGSSIPFLSVGAQKDRGNGMAVGIMDGRARIRSLDQLRSM